MGELMSEDKKSVATTKFEKKLIQDQYNTNVAFYVHINEFNNSVRAEIDKHIGEVFYFLRGIDWNFDSYGVEKSGSRGNNIVCYFILRSADVKKLQKLFVDYFKEYDNAVKITCSVTKYEKIDEEFFELDL
jgi:hypothetical protein